MLFDFISRGISISFLDNIQSRVHNNIIKKGGEVMKNREKAKRQREYRTALLNFLTAVIGALMMILNIIDKLLDRR